MGTLMTTLSMEVTTWVLSWAFAIQFLPVHLKVFQVQDAAFYGVGSVKPLNL